MKRRTAVLIPAAVVVIAALAVSSALVSKPDAGRQETTAQVATAAVEQDELAAVISASGILTYQAHPDGSAYLAINRAHGTYTQLPEAGDEVACGSVLYRVDDAPVVLLCGAIPTYRALKRGDTGADVAQLAKNLHTLGYDKAAGVRIRTGDDAFTSKTEKSLARLQHDKGQAVTGKLAAAGAVVLPQAIRVSKVIGQLGGPARSGSPAVEATSDALVVQLSLDPSRRTDVPKGSAALVTLPGSTTATGKVAQVGSVASAPEGSPAGAGDATILVTVTLDDPDTTEGLDQAPVRAQITTAGVQNALSVPAVALVGNSGGGYAVDVVRDDGRRELVAVTLGLFDDASGRVQVEGSLTPGDSVVVPS